MTHPTIFDYIKVHCPKAPALVADAIKLGLDCVHEDVDDVAVERYAQRMLLEHDVAPKGQYVLQVDGKWALGRTVRVVTPQTDMAGP